MRKRMRSNLLLIFCAVIILLSPLNVQFVIAGYSLPASFPNAARCGTTATLIQSGEILVVGGSIRNYLAGGSFSPKLLDTAAVFDSTTNTWSDAASMGTPRSGHSALLLPNGRVLVAGGFTTTGTIKQPMLYDPLSNTWSSISYPYTDNAYSNVTMTLLLNGKVLISGDFTATKLYDPDAGIWSLAAPPAVLRINHTATLLPNGKVLVTGGAPETGEALPSSELYDPANNTWSTVTSMSSARYGHTATLLPNGKVLVQGGKTGYDFLSIIYSAELFDPATNTWSSAGVNPLSTYRSTATLLPNGKVAVMGGSDEQCVDQYSPKSKAIMLYDPVTNSWTQDVSMQIERSFHTANLLPDGKVFLTGNCDCNGEVRSAYDVGEFYYSTAPGSWVARGSLATPRRDHAATILPNSKTLVVGGNNNGTHLRSTEIFDPASKSWSTAGSLAAQRSLHTITLLTDGRVIAVGGFDGSSSLASAELYDQASGIWSLTNELTQGRKGHTATLLPNGDLLVVGGFNGSTPLKTAEIYSPSSNSWKPHASLNTARSNHTATLLDDGKILVAGGFDGARYLDSVELYDPVANKWSVIAPLGKARAYHTAILSADGSMIVSGGNDGTGSIVTIEYFDPESNGWVEFDAAVPTGRTGHTATLLQDGSILFAGGANGASYSTDTDIYFPITDLWYSGGSMAATRTGHTATLQVDGTVLVAGGYNSATGFMSTCELFIPNIAINNSLRSVVTDAGIQANQSGLLVTGSNFRGFAEGSSGAANSSSSGIPIVQLKRLDNGQSSFLLSDPTRFWSRDSFVSESLADLFLPVGYYQATVFANAIPGISKIFPINSSVAPAPALGISPVPVEFGDATSSTVKTVMVSNNGNADLVLSEVSVKGTDASQFALTTSNLCWAGIVPGTNCQMDVTFTPVSSSPATAALRILSNDPNNENYEIPLVSSGYAPKMSLLLSLSGNGSGRVDFMPSPPGTVCTSGCGQSFTSGTSVTLTSTANAGSFFAGWTGCDSVNGNICAVVMSGDKNITAAFSDIAIGTTLLDDGYAGTGYSRTLAATGGTAPYGWSITGGSTPAGLTLNSVNGVISGTPATAGTSTFTVQVTDSANAKVTKQLSITVYASLAISTTSLAAGKTGTSYSQTVSATGGKLPYAWSIASGSLPTGLILNSSSGNISGIPGTSGTSSFTVQVIDANSVKASKALSIATTAATLAVSTTTLPAGNVGGLYSQTLAAMGGTPPYVWSRTKGTIPAGLTLSTAGVLSGTPTRTVTNSSITFQVKDATAKTATKAISITINAAVAALSVSTSSLTAGMVGTVYSQTLAATGGKTPYSWSITSGSLPAGLSLAANTGAITGTPTTAGSNSFTVQVKDVNNSIATKALSITVNSPALAVSTTTLPNGYVGVAYSQALSAIGGAAPYTWTKTAGTIPTGLTLSSAGVISGTPTTVLTNSSITFQVKDANNSITTKALTISISAPALTITSTSLPAGNVGLWYDQMLTAIGGQSPYTWSISSGSLPTTLLLDTSRGRIYAYPDTLGTKSFTVKIKDANNITATKALSIKINELPSITADPTIIGTVDTPFRCSLSVSGSYPPYSWSIPTDSLPPGLSFNASTATISGTPTVEADYNFTIRLKDVNNVTYDVPFELWIKPVFRVNTETLLHGNIGASYRQVLSAGGGTAPYSWAVTGDTLPAGLQLISSGSDSGIIAGTPTTPGTNTIMIQATDSAGKTASRALTIDISAAPVIAPITLSTGFTGTAYSQTVKATGGTPPYTWAIIQGDLPAGLVLDPASGEISGIPTVTGFSSFTIQARDIRYETVTVPLATTITSYSSISGVVTNEANGAPLAGVSVTLALTGITNTGTTDRVYTCNNSALSSLDYDTVATNDDAKFSCLSGIANSMQFKVRNPYGTDPFTINWNGMATSTVEYLAQSFKPTIGGNLNKVSFYLANSGSGNDFAPITGEMYVQLKSKLGGDIGVRLAESNSIRIDSVTIGTGTWVDFIFPAPASITAGQEYYLEIQGKFEGGDNYWQNDFSYIGWGNGTAYTNGSAHKRNFGLWSRLGDSLAFRTYQDNQLDVDVERSAIPSVSTMLGSLDPRVYMQLFNSVTGTWEGIVSNDNTVHRTYEGEYVYSSADLTRTLSVNTGLDHYYDRNGWLAVKVENMQVPWWFTPPNTSLVTDQFSITFNRTLTAVTDVNGAYSFPELPAGAYTVVVDKAPYKAQLVTGSLQVGQSLSINTALAVDTEMHIITNAFALGSVGNYYIQAVSATGGRAPYKWSVIAGALPGGLTLNSSTGVISGTPGIADSGIVVVQVQDATNKTSVRAFTIKISQTSGQPRISVSPSEISFGGTNIGKTLASVVTVTNTGTTDLAIGQVSRPFGPYQVITDNCSGMTLAAAATCTMTIQFAPSHAGSFYDTIVIPSSDENYPDISVYLNGSGIISYLLPDTGRGEPARNPISFTVNSDNSATDANTRLMWQRSGSAAAMTWPESETYCKNLALDGHNDWRLPTFLELTTIVNYGAANPAIDAAVFPGTQADNYWTTHEGTGSANSNPELYATVVNFAYGEAHPQAKTYSAFVRCTRGETLTTTLHSTGDVTAEYPYTNGLVSIDQNTGLLWAGNPITYGFDPYICDPTGSSGCTTLSASNACNVLKYAGSQNWRMPTIKELATLSGQPCFLDSCTTISATPSGRPDASGNLTNVYMYSPGSDIISLPPGTSHYVNCVQGGNNFNVASGGDIGNVAVMAMAGDFAATSQPRQEIAKEYIRTHGDNFDFLVFLSTFDYTLPNGAQGLYTPVKNDTQGINRNLFDYTTQFGSSGKLQGTIDLGNVTSLAAAPYGPKLDQTLTILGHEINHRFGSYVRYKNPDGTLNTTLLGETDCHWSYLLDSKGSLMYGNGWLDNTNGTFTSVANQSGYSPLDLYLMGMIPKEQVPPMLLIDNASIDKTQLPHLGDTISGTAKTITIDDIVAAEGERIPNAASSQKQFNVGFVLLTRAGENTTAATQAVETLRKAWAGRFAELTQGKASVANVFASLDIAVDSPANGATITGPDVTVSGTVINSSGVETGVTINGMPATVSGNRFIVNHVPLQQGSNTLSITANDANGLTATATRNVSTAVGNYIRITSNIESGIAPLKIFLRLDGSFTINSPQITYTGLVPVTLAPGTSPAEFTATLTTEGTYTFTSSAVGPDGQTYSDTVTVTVVSRQALETLLKAKWEGMKQKILAGDTAGAGSYFDLSTRDMFQTFIDDPTMEIMSRLSEISAIEIYTVQNDTVQGGAIRQEDDGVYAYPVNFTRDENGIWRIYGF